MDPFIAVSMGLIVAVLALVVTIRLYSDKVGKLRDELRAASAARQDAARERDAMRAQWAPVLARYPFDPAGYRHVGGFVDGIQLEEDRIVFVAFTGGAPLAPAAQRTRDLVRAGRVDWVEVPLSQAAPDPSAP